MNILLNEILAAREERARRQQTLLLEYGCPVISFTMNIAGPVKTAPIIRRAFDYGLSALEKALVGYPIHSRTIIHAETGDEAMLCVDAKAEELKALCTAIEEASSMGRLFDMDVLNTGGRKLARSSERSCLVCGAPGRGCASRRLHSVEQLQAATRDLITAHFDPGDAERIADAAARALIDEVRTTPKPGLVDLRNNGSHSDMDVPLFLASADALRPYFRRCAQIGQETAGLAPPEAFPLLKEAGLAAEDTMLAVTGGVNTHKGAIYTLGILCAGFGSLLHTGDVSPIPEKVLNQCMWIAGDAARSDLEQSSADTAGLRAYRELGITGIRGEMALGLPSVSHIALPLFRQMRSKGYSNNDAGVYTLLHLIAEVQDTNLLHRGGPEGAAYAAHSARELLKQDPSVGQIEALDDLFIARNLSPGGCADLLAATYLIDELCH